MKTFRISDLFNGRKLTSEVTSYRCNHCGIPFFVHESSREREIVCLKAIPCPECENSNYELGLLQFGTICIEIKSEMARQLADYSLIENDITGVISACDRLLTELSNEVVDEIVCASLWTQALIRYGRCFGSQGFRKSVSVEPFVKEEFKTIHQYFRDIRDKHIAHSVNNFENAAVGVVISAPNEDDKKVFEVGVLDYRVAYSTGKIVENLRELAADIVFTIHGEKEKLCNTLLDEMKTKPINEFYSDAQDRLALIADLSSPSKKRKQ